MNRVRPWEKLLPQIIDIFPKRESERRPFPVATVLREFFSSAWLNLSHLAIEDEKGLRLALRTIEDATIIHAPSSTENEKKERDSDMKSSKTGNLHLNSQPDLSVSSQ